MSVLLLKSVTFHYLGLQFIKQILKKITDELNLARYFKARKLEVVAYR